MHYAVVGHWLARELQVAGLPGDLYAKFLAVVLGLGRDMSHGAA